MNNTGGAVDVWAVAGVDVENFRDNGNGSSTSRGASRPIG
jgi:hypothetical protein